MTKIPFIIIFSLGIWTSASAGIGNLFTVNSSAPEASVNFVLCLNAKAPLSCQHYQAKGINLKIDSSITKRNYPINAGIKVNTPGYSASGCTPLANGYCSFNIYKNQSTLLTLNNPNNLPTISSVGFYESFSGPFIVRAISYYTNDYGKNWITSTTQPVDGTNDLEMINVKCSKSGHCVTVGIDITNNTIDSPVAFTSNDGGNHWAIATTQPVLLGQGVDDMTLSCDNTGTRCVATANYFINNGNTSLAGSYISTDGGQNWTTSTQFPTPPPQTPSGLVTSIDCSSDGLRCAAVGYYTNTTIFNNASYFTIDGGQNWTTSTIQPVAQGSNNNNSMVSVACDNSGIKCTAVGTYTNGSNNEISSYTSSDGGQTWAVSNTQPLPSGTANVLYGVSCDLSGLKCAAAGVTSTNNISQPLTYYSIDGGVNWILSPGQPPDQAGNGVLSSIACDDTGSLCSTVGYNGTAGANLFSYYSTDGGQNWALSNTIPPSQGGPSATNILYNIG